MSVEGSKLSGEAFQPRFPFRPKKTKRKRKRKGKKLRFSIVKLIPLMCFIRAWLWHINSWLQLKFGGSSSEDHQFVRGIPIYTISQVLDKILSGANGPPLLINGVKQPMPLVRILEVELYPTLLSKARSFGLSDDWVQVHILPEKISYPSFPFV